jgi:ribonuclease HI
VNQNPVPVPPATVVYTDGACSGNPGPGGWAWAVPRGRYASGARARTTNQRMEIMAVLEAAKALDGPLEVVSDSTYVINCITFRWVKGHSGDPMNELVDQLAREALRTQQGRQGVASKLGHKKLRRNESSGWPSQRR